MKRITTALFILSFITLIGCQANTPEIQHITGFAQGTTYSISFWVEETTDTSQLAGLIDEELKRIDQVMSNYRGDSVIEQFNRGPAGTPLDSEIHQLMKQGHKVYQATDGCYDPTSLPLFKLWGFRDDQITFPETSLVEQTLPTIGLNRLPLNQPSTEQIDPAIHLDLSSIGQGYAVTQLARILQQNGVQNHLVEIGGEMMATGHKPNEVPWRIGVERPVPNSQQINAVITIHGPQAVAVMTSGTYRHYYDKDGTRYSHIIDPRVGQPVKHQTVAVTVLMSDATLADAWSTGLLCLGTEAGLAAAQAHGIAAIFFELDGHQLRHQMTPAVTSARQAWSIEFID